ncbi:hypothetical protein MEO40_22535 [Dolichospermum sp. ST_sed1]|nr:hypothetical protein [Dolichospermum sp. ST_sed1]MDD1427269.1 hypothetical protein [Dolichospermum sp. ST_sed9]MDD1432747.1 hypothetical protein [Dolichospermum sp. ST_sed6]MDD1438005.1 hypothetical protein [Dolichospermum sp. ST_sed10]MDD1443043.1 hypothetical protein [Dolichospermum sp. ST_sed3]MDD1448213.1 hypothetical protein [Dolichospermum sp. ST_sed8]MDD1457441.1 hypothetical protein [Dolichospermum sp. ST_sed7]MDD1462916.1 hypothetical protein [Dolichospermum sp. ST_sed2]MDD14689
MFQNFNFRLLPQKVCQRLIEAKYPDVDQGIEIDTPLFAGVYDLSPEGARTAIAYNGA